MKNAIITGILLFFTAINFGQNYDRLWQDIEKLDAKGLPKSALKALKPIALLAKQDNNEVQEIKVLLYKSKYLLAIEEDAQLKIIDSIKNDIKTSTFPKKNILQNILAKLYWQYFTQNRWRFYNRTKTSKKINPNDFRTWDLETLFNDINTLHKNALTKDVKLQQVPLKKYDAILVLKKQSKTYRPTLFDFLCNNALDFYKTNETHITKPAYKFNISSKHFLGDAVTFSKLNITSRDSTSLQLNALKTYQKLIKFHLKNQTLEALADINIKRLNFVKQHATFSNKNSLILQALKTDKAALKNHSTTSLYDFEMAKIHKNTATKYNANAGDLYKWDAKTALAICNEAIGRHPNSKGAKKCQLLKQSILKLDLKITSEDFLPIQKNARLLINYKNLNRVDFKIFKVNKTEFETFNKLYKKEEKTAFLNRLKVLKAWDNVLPNQEDYQPHRVEVIVPKLNNGTYIIRATANNQTKTFAINTFKVTNIALVETDSKEQKTFQFINRNNGKPIINQIVTARYYTNNNNNKITKQFTTNKYGQVNIKKEQLYYRGLSIEIATIKDKTYFNNLYINKAYKQQDKKLHFRAFTFTDRSIYRPTQTVFFKSIIIKKEALKSAAFTNQLCLATLYNANNEKISSLELKTNDFGSISGEFILPNSGLNGNYSIKISHVNHGIYGVHNIKVEAYKRPKFNVAFKPITKTYKVNDSVMAKGVALAYTGTPVTNAKITYRVQRQVNYPQWYFWRRPYYTSENQEIAYGTSITNNLGEFNIVFKALADQNIKKTNLPIFTYFVKVDVTDVNGETQSSNTNIQVGYHSLLANIEVNPVIDKNKKNQVITLRTKNINGVFAPAKGEIKIHKLKAPQQVLRSRPWDSPDYKIINKDNFKSLFPHDAYGNEHLKSNWEKGTLILKQNFNTNTSDKVELKNIKKWPTGAYLITITCKDKYGQQVTDQAQITLLDFKSNTLVDRALFSISTNKKSYTTNESVLLKLESAAKPLVVTLHIDKKNTATKTQIVTLNSNTKTLKIPVTQNDLGGFSISYSYAAYNSFKTNNISIDVPHPETKLSIETETFRDFLKPGTNETWRFKIKGPKGNQVSAEVLASMYDASLDQFKPNNWSFNPLQKQAYNAHNTTNGYRSFGTSYFRVYNKPNYIGQYPNQGYDTFNWFGFYFNNSNRYNKSFRRSLAYSKGKQGRPARLEQIEVVEDDQEITLAENSNNIVLDAPYKILKKESEVASKTKKTSTFNARKNLNETAFFIPKLKTDKDGIVSFTFNTPEALTQWKVQLLAHTKQLKSHIKTLTTVTKKELMVTPNTPRFVRHGDQIKISTKITNATKQDISGTTTLQLFNAITGKKIDIDLKNNTAEQKFNIDANQNTTASWQLSIPDYIEAIQYKIIAKTKNYSDGEQRIIPVLSNRKLVTETLPMWISGNTNKTFYLNKLKNNTSSTLKHHKLTLELSSNPKWYAVMALPYLMEHPYTSNEQIFSRYYANSLAKGILKSNPKIKTMFNLWKNTEALESNLEKNKNLKTILIEETPWLRDAQSESEQKKRIALLFNSNKINFELQDAFNKLKNNQMPSGAWSWFKGGKENRYITQHIMAGLGHLNKLNKTQQNTALTNKAIKYLDQKFIEQYLKLKKTGHSNLLKNDQLSYIQLHYLYMRSFYTDIEKTDLLNTVTKYYYAQINKHWLKHSLYAKGLMSIIMYRNNQLTTVTRILKSLKEHAITSKELGMYWKENTNSWLWHQAPLETQALLIEAFTETGHTIHNTKVNTAIVDQLKIWLLKHKQTNRWATTKATTKAIYALLLHGNNWLNNTNLVTATVGNQNITPSTIKNDKQDPGTGYYKKSWHTKAIEPSMGVVKLSKKDQGIAWGSLYWQYFEELDNITASKTPLQINKKLFLKTNTSHGEQITEITNQTRINIGDLITVRMVLKNDRDMTFIHLKDMRASGLEPTHVISGYKWQDGLGYYQSTKDASTNFFFDFLPKGVYVFEYDLRANNSGIMSNGITSIQCLYAPEFSSHSKGDKININ